MSTVNCSLSIVTRQPPILIFHYQYMSGPIKYCLIFTFIFNLHHLYGQSHKYLLLERGRSLKKIRIYPGSLIRLRFRGDDHFYTEQIKDLSGNFIFFENAVVKVSEIAEIDITGYKDRSPLFINLGKKLPLVGAGYFLIDNFNRSVVNSQPFEIDKKVARTSSVMAGVGFLFILFEKKTFKVKGRNRLRVVNLLPQENNEN